MNPTQAQAEIAAQEARLQAAQQTFEQRRAELRRPDGSAKFAPAEEAERVAQLQQPVIEAATKARAVVDAAREAIRIAELPHDPWLDLSPADLNHALLAQAHAKDLAAKMPVEEFARQVDAAAQSSAKPIRLAYRKVAEDRQADIMRQSVRAKLEPPKGTAELAAAINRLRQADPAPAPTGPKPSDLRYAADKLQLTAGQIERSLATTPDQRAAAAIQRTKQTF